ncbi:HPF/RaiA family ribosome-associated protein [Amycolatopsis sp. NPDC021455]|uniref:HPF/RaiA family ribosome-associated protein n=1 Tax=Amycolatopsis sp. NPDC021455 TaxID=3154901 RepID=UPI0033C4FA05
MNTIGGMEIRINTSKNVHGGEDLAQRLEGEFATALARFAGEIGILQVHLSGDPNLGGRHRRCVLEARPAGHAPVVVTNEAGSVLEACQGAAHKLESALESKYGRTRHHKGGETIRRPEVSR